MSCHLTPISIKLAIFVTLCSSDCLTLRNSFFEWLLLSRVCVDPPYRRIHIVNRRFMNTFLEAQTDVGFCARDGCRSAAARHSWSGRNLGTPNLRMKCVPHVFHPHNQVCVAVFCIRQYVCAIILDIGGCGYPLPDATYYLLVCFCYYTLCRSNIPCESHANRS